MELKTLIFDKPGKHNTDATLAIARERAQALGIKQIVVASSHGFTARKAHEVFAPLGVTLVVVTICHSWEDQGWCMTAEERRQLQALGLKVHTGVHALGDGVGAAFADKRGGIAAEEVVRETLYRFCQGMKVAVECMLMAADAGLLNMAEEVISIAGTSDGADTAIVCRPAYPRTFHQMRILEVLAKPR